MLVKLVFCRCKSSCYLYRLILVLSLWKHVSSWVRNDKMVALCGQWASSNYTSRVHWGVLGLPIDSRNASVPFLAQQYLAYMEESLEFSLEDSSSIFVFTCNLYQEANRILKYLIRGSNLGIQASGSVQYVHLQWTSSVSVRISRSSWWISWKLLFGDWKEWAVDTFVKCAHMILNWH